MEPTEKISYSNTLITERPKNGIESSITRIVSAIKLNEELADYFRDRAQVEDAYAKNIAKLSKKHYITNKAALGTFLPLWEMLQMELSRLATIHGEYASIIMEEIEQPLRTSIQKDTDYANIHDLEDHLQKVAKEFDDLDIKIQKLKKNTKSEAKAIEFIKQQDQKLDEWKNDAPQFLSKCQNIDENRLNNLKSTVHKFETIQQTHAERVIELTGNCITAASNLRVDDEIAAFCASHTINTPITQHTIPAAEPVVENSSNNNNNNNNNTLLVDIDNVVPEPSISENSVKQPVPAPQPIVVPSKPASIKKEKKRFFPTFASIRRKPKVEQHVDHSAQLEQSNRQRSLSNSESFIESSSVQSVNTHSTDHNTPETSLEKSISLNNFSNNSHPDLMHSQSLASMNQPTLRNVASFNSSFTNLSQQPPLIQVDSEGYSIPPPDRNAWPGDNNATGDALIDADDFNSDAGSMMNSPKIRVDIKNEVVNEEDASQSAVALSRVATLLKEKNPGNSPNTRRLRGRREMRATQLFSVVEQDKILANVNGSIGAVPSPTSPVHSNLFVETKSDAMIANPFETNQNKFTEDLSTSSNTVHVNVTETVHLISRGGIIEKSVIWGEVSIQYDGSGQEPIYIKLNNPKKFDAIETTEFISNVLDGGIYQLNTQQLNDHQVCIKYQTKLDQDLIPFTVKPMWKCEDDKSRLLVKYYKHNAVSSLENVKFVTSVTGDVQNALSIPAGELILSQKRIMWHLGQINDNNESVIKAQFTTLEQGSPQPIAIRFDVKGQLLTDLNIHSGTQPDNLSLSNISNFAKTVKTGKYVAYM